MIHVAINGVNIAKKSRPNKGGSRIIAFFDCAFYGFQLNGCALVRTSKNGLTVWPPKIEGPEAVRRAVVITDDALRNAIMQAARDAYQAIGGTEAEWIPFGQVSP